MTKYQQNILKNEVAALRTAAHILMIKADRLLEQLEGGGASSNARKGKEKLTIDVKLLLRKKIKPNAPKRTNRSTTHS